MPESGNFRRMGLTLSGLMVATLPAAALDADQVLNFNWGRLTLKPQLDLTGVYTDNVFYGNNSVLVYTPLTQFATNSFTYDPITRKITGGTPSGRIEAPRQVISRPVEQEFLQYISPGARLAYGYSDANHLSLEYGFDKIFYLEHPSYDTDQQNILFNADFSAGHWKLKGSDQIQFLSSFIGGGFFDGNQQANRRLWNDNYRFDYEISPKTFAYVSGLHDNQEWDKGLNIYNTDTLRGSLGGGYNLSDLLSVFAEGHYGQSAISPNNVGQPKGPHSEFYGGYVGIKGDFTARITGSVKVGYETRTFPDGSGASASGTGSPIVEATLTYAPTLRTQLTLTYSRKTDISQQFGQQAVTADTIGLTALQNLGTSGKWFVQVAGNYLISDASDLTSTFNVRTPNTTGVLLDPRYVGVTSDGSAAILQDASELGTATGNIGRTDTQFSVGPTLVYQPRPWLQASLGYQFQYYSPSFRDALYASTHQLIGYTANEFTLRVSIGF